MRIIAKNSAPSNTNNPDELTKLKIKKSTECTGFLEVITKRAERTAINEKK